MKTPGLNFGEMLRRLGIRAPGWSPETAEQIQPVVVVSDVSILVPPLLPATALAGGEFASNAVRFPAFQFQSIAPGGAFVRTLRITPAGAASLRTVIRTTPLTFVTSVLPTRYNMGPTPVQSVLTLGDVAALSTAVNTDAAFGITGFAQAVIDDVFFIPSGSFLIVEYNAVNQTFYVAMTWQEIPASAP